MQLEHSFVVPVGVEDAWKVLLDVESVAPCMPGATVDSVDGDDFTGSVKVKVGPISLLYTGNARFVEKDEADHRVVISASGKDKRGAGTAAANVTASLSAKDDATTEVSVVTDLNVTGKPAQFGRGVMADVGNKIIGQFADCLAAKISAGELASSAAGAAEPTVAAEPTGAAESTRQDAPVDTPFAAPQQQIKAADEINVLAMAPAKAKQVAVGIGVGALLLALIVWLIRRTG